MKITTHVLTLSLTVALVSCAGQQKKTTATTADAVEAADAVEEVEPAPVKSETSTFRALNYKQRAEFMKTAIVPPMTRVFQDFDATHFAAVTCVTCHGPGAKDGRFDMPTPALPRLDFSSKDPKHQTWSAFMGSKVVPAMVSALGEQAYDPATRKGFGCLSCHLRAAK